MLPDCGRLGQPHSLRGDRSAAGVGAHARGGHRPGHSRTGARHGWPPTTPCTWQSLVAAQGRLRLPGI
jgi:hypothetical protein